MLFNKYHAFHNFMLAKYYLVLLFVIICCYFILYRALCQQINRAWDINEH